MLDTASRRITMLTGQDNFIYESFLLGAEGALLGFATLGTREHVESLEEVELVTGNKIGGFDQIRRTDCLRAEAQVRDRYRAGLLRVIDKVALGVEIGLGADDLDRVLIRSDRAVGAQSVEESAYCIRPLDGKAAIEPC